ncbi:MAG: GntR family transcriptional regulator [Fibrella sp.]|nr:GntR family transcriptional regulator [Armatimonadota bacterium]
MLRSFRYEEIADNLRQQIQQGKYPCGERLPGERALMRQYGVQRNTIRQALSLLQEDGLLVTRARSGVYIQPITETPVTGDVPSYLPPAEGIILVINAWNRSSTAVDRLMNGLSGALESTSLSIQRFNSLPRPGSRFHVLPTHEYLTANNVVGAILWAQSPTDLAALIRLRTMIPLVLVDRRVLGFEADCVRFDDVAGGRMVTEHLIARGHREIGFLADEAFAETIQQRWRGYTTALAEAGIPYDSSRVALFEGIKDPPFSAYARLFLTGTSPLTAVVCSNDSTALTLFRFLRNEGYRIPEDVAVTGYGNLLPDYMDTLELTTVAQPFEETGRVAGELLRERIQSGNNTTTNSGFRQRQLPVELIVRNSSNVTPRIKNNAGVPDPYRTD